MFLTEQDLRDTFWANYNYNHRAIKYQFECPLRQGNIDLVTVEKFQENYQINAFEFKLDDIKKVLLQAKGNIPYCNKSWIVVPGEKKKVILERYKNYLDDAKHIGAIAVEEGGKWEMIYRPLFKRELVFEQPLLNFLMRGL